MPSANCACVSLEGVGSMLCLQVSLAWWCLHCQLDCPSLSLTDSNMLMAANFHFVPMGVAKRCFAHLWREIRKPDNSWDIKISFPKALEGISIRCSQSQELAPLVMLAGQRAWVEEKPLHWIRKGRVVLQSSQSGAFHQYSIHSFLGGKRKKHALAEYLTPESALVFLLPSRTVPIDTVHGAKLIGLDHGCCCLDAQGESTGNRQLCFLTAEGVG